MNDLVSVIIVNYNGKKWLKKLFDSLFYQIYKNFEIIFVDNASIDESIEFVKNNYSDDRVRIVKSDKNLGFAGGNNLGIKNSRGNYILLLNNDTWIDADFLKKTLLFYKDNNFDIIAPFENDYEDKNRDNDREIRIDLFGHAIPLKNSISNGFYLSGACLFFSKKTYYDTLGLDDDFFMYFEEVDWFWRLNLFNKKKSYIKNLFVHHAPFSGPNKGIMYNSFLWRNQNCLQMLLKNYSWFNLLWVLPIYFLQNIFEITFFLIILKPKISLSYFQGWWFNIGNINKTLEKRRWIQKNRVVGDLEIIKKMYIGFAKADQLISFIKRLK